MHAFLSHTRAGSVIICVMCRWDVLRPSPVFANAVCIASLILHTARYFYVYYVQKFALMQPLSMEC